MTKEIKIPEGYEAKIEDNKVIFVPKESEDERIRKNLIELLLDTPAQDIISHHLELSKVLAYLEKQKEQKPGLEKANDLRAWLNIVSKVLTEFQGIGQYLDNPICQEIANMLREKYCFDDASSDWDRVYRKGLDAGEIYGYNKAKKEQKPSPKFRVGDMMRTKQEAAEEIIDGIPVVVSIDEDYYICNNEKILIADQEEYECPPMNRRQNPAEWSEDDKCMYDSIMCEVVNEGMNLTPEQANWIKLLPERFNIQPKQEWGEEDKETIEKLHRLLVICRGEKKFIQEADYNKMDNLLKSLRPQPHWKPSEEQMRSLEWWCKVTKETPGGNKLLVALYNDLKKL